jgi:hypothetical protein
MERTEVVAFANDLIMATRGELVRAVENYVNVELSKIDGYSKNKNKFNDKISKVILISRRKRKENKNITVYLNHIPLDQVTQMKYLGIILNHTFRFKKNKVCRREMHKAHSQLIKSDKTVMGVKHTGDGHYIQRHSLTSTNIRSSSLDGSHEL